MVDYDNWGEKPLPQVDQESEEYWDRAAQGELLIQVCNACGERQFYPRSVCRNCWSDDITFQQHDGTGTIYSFTINHIPGESGYEDELPYIVALVDLDLPDDNPSGRPARMTTHLVDCSDDDVEVGLPVDVTFKQISDDPEIHLPVFRPQ